MAIVKIGNRTTVFYADKAGTTYQLAANKTIDTDTYGIVIEGDHAGRVLDIDGTVDGQQNGIRIDTYSTGLPPVRVDIGVSGQVISEYKGIVSWGNGHVITNAGSIEGTTTGMEVHGEHIIVNKGVIEGGIGINVFAGTGQGTVIRNSGTISGTDKAIYGSGEVDRITNTGTIEGEVNLSGGNDTFVFKGGSLNGVVRGEIGDDLYIAKKAGLNIVEDIDQGTDTVKSSVSFTLQANVENLHLIGKSDIAGTGNGSNNEIHGNIGRNRLDGGYGFDLLDGGEGNDVLIGGVGSDEFHFQRGTGKDIVKDYEAGFDELHLETLEGSMGFQDMIDNHATEKNGDVWISYGSDTIVIKDHAIADLQAGDFFFPKL